MLNEETFLTELYVLVDDLLAADLAPERHPGPVAGLARSEVVTLGVYGQWWRFRSETAFHTHAERVLRPLFPGLPSRSRFNRLLRRHRAAITRLALLLAEQLGAGTAEYEVIDGTGVPTRNAQRRGRGWLWGEADIGWCTRLGWYEGVRLLLAVTPAGVVTGFGVGPASANDRSLADALFALRAAPDPRLPSAGRPAASGDYVADMGFAGREREAHWAAACGARVTCPPQSGTVYRRWGKRLRRWLAGVRQVVETVNDRLLGAFGLDRERPHDLSGLQARLAAKAALHNVVIWLNRRAGRPDLAIAGVIDWD